MKAKLQEKITLIENYLDKLLTDENAIHGTIFKAMRYSLLAGGKRLRPVMTLSFCEMSGGKAEDALPFAAALEMIHTYSLIHDDLPAMDNDDLRRGRPTNHKVFGEGIAVLAGDALLNYAFEHILESKLSQDNPKMALEGLSCLGRAAGANGMIGGQVIDLESEGKKIGKDTLLTLQKMKTGALFSAAAQLGCIAGNASKKQREAAVNYANKIGLSFQIKDDLLDVEGTVEEMGKTLGKDLNQEKSTFLSVFSTSEARCEVIRLTDEAILELAAFENHEFLAELTRELANRTK